MAENTGKTRGSLVASIQSAQMAVGNALTGGTAAVAANDNGSIPILEDLRAIGKENERNTQGFMDILRQMFQFDKDAYARERSQAAELRKEKRDEAGGQTFALPSKEEATGGLKMPALAGLFAVAAFAKALNVEDILRLPQQIKSIKGMATFAKGIGTISTLGFGPKLVDDFKAAMKVFGGNLSKGFKANISGPILAKFDDFKMKLPKAPFSGVVTFFDDMMKPIKGFFQSPTMKMITKNIDEAGKTIAAVFAPFKNAITGLFGGGAAAGQGAGAFAKITGPLKAFGKAVSKLFLPLTIILGIFDGVSGFMKEYEETGSIVDGIRGAVVGIVDGFIGSFVRLITDLVGMALSFLGLDNLGSYISEFGENLTGSFSDVIGGLVDFVMGIFTLDVDRIWGGLKGVAGGVADFFFTVVSAPLDMAINFLKDIFNFGDPDQPFSLKEFFLGEDGPVMSAWNWFKGLFTFDFTSIKEKIFAIGTMMKALAKGGLAAAGAMLPGGESPGEAFSRVFNEVMSSAGGGGDNITNEGDEIKKITTENIQGDVTETVMKTTQIDKTTDGQGEVVYIDQSVNNSGNPVSSIKTANMTTTDLNTTIDPYHDRASYNFFS